MKRSCIGRVRIFCWENKSRVEQCFKEELTFGEEGHTIGPSVARDVGLDATVEDVSYSIEDVHFPLLTGAKSVYTCGRDKRSD